MKYQTYRALYYTFLAQEIERESTADVWRQIAEQFGVPDAERQAVEELLSDPTLAALETVDDIRLFRKCASGFGGRLQRLTEKIDDEVLELKHQALLKVKQLTGEQKTTLLKAAAAVYQRDPTAAVLYALQILLRNKKRKELGCQILFEALSSGQSSDAGIILLNGQQWNVGVTFFKLAETPEMILHPEVQEELAKAHGINPATTQRNHTRIGF